MDEIQSVVKFWCFLRPLNSFRWSLLVWNLGTVIVAWMDL